VFRTFPLVRTRAEAPRYAVGRRRSGLTECAGADEQNQHFARLSDELELLLIEAERKHLYALLCNGQLKDDARRHIERELDLREVQLLRTTPRSGNDEA